MILFILSDWDEHLSDEVRISELNSNWQAWCLRSLWTSTTSLRVVLWRHHLSHVLILLSTGVVSSRSIFLLARW